VIQLQYRLADEILPTLQPLLDPGAALSGSGDLIFVRTSPANLQQIRSAVAALDRAPRQLLITVGQATEADRSGASVRGSATIDSGDVQVGVNRPPGADTGVEARASAATRDQRLDNVSSVRTLEGNETLIAIGQSVPVTTVQPHPGGGASRTTTYRDISTGFYATARVSGDRVTLEISPRQQDFGSARRTVETNQVTTMVAGRLGEWIPLGAVTQSSSGSTQGMLVWGTRDSRSQYSAWVKVEEVR
jgi:type II secretory pathway component GspD/PulD (secretin)